MTLEIVDFHGMRVGVLSATNAVELSGVVDHLDVDMLRVVEPPLDLRGQLRESGFLVKPQRLSWPGALGEGEESVLARMSPNARRQLRRARRAVHSAGLMTVVKRPMDEADMVMFLTLYEAQMSSMERGMPYALWQRDSLLEHRDRWFGIFSFLDAAPVGACLAEEAPSFDCVKLRFSAVMPQFRALSVGKVLYFHAMNVARDAGYGWVTLGIDRNLYGLSAAPSLFSFKARLGFTAVPSQNFYDPDGVDLAERILTLRCLQDPSLVLAYDRDDSSGLTACVLTANEQVDLSPFSATFLDGIQLRSVGAR